jgi:hypothetical protein
VPLDKMVSCHIADPLYNVLATSATARINFEDLEPKLLGDSIHGCSFATPRRSTDDD